LVKIRDMKKILITIVFLFTFAVGFSQITILEPLKEPCLVTFKENPVDTFALVNINRIKNINEKLVYMYELMCVKDSLYSIVDKYDGLVKTKNEIIRVQSLRIDDLNKFYQQAQSLLAKADKIMIDQNKKIKTKNRTIWGLGISTGALAGLLIISLIVK